MRLNLLGGTQEGFSSNNSDQLTENFYASVEQGSRSNIVLHPTPGAIVTSSTDRGSFTGGSIEVGGAIYSKTDDDLYKGTSAIATALFATTTAGRNSFATSGANTNNQILCVTQDGVAVISVTYDTAWLLDGTSTYNENSTTDGATTAFKLIDSTANFVAGTSVELGMTVHNITDDTWAFITAVDSTTQLTLSADIMATGEDYEIAASYDGTGASALAASPPFTTPNTGAFMDGRFIVDDQSTDTPGRFYISKSYDACRWDSLDFATAERHYDKLQAVNPLNRELWLVGEQTTEAWYNSGDPDFTFSTIQSGLIQMGTQCPYTVLNVNNKMLWLAHGDGGFLGVAMTNGLTAQIVSTPDITQQMKEYTLDDTAFALTYSSKGNDFYCLTFPTDNITLVYNLTTGLWHTWSKDSAEFPATGLAFLPASNEYYYHDNDGRQYQLTDARISIEDSSGVGESITRKRRSQVVHADGKFLTHHAVMIDFDFNLVDVVVSISSPTLLTQVQADFSTMGITTGVDYVNNITTGEQSNAITVVGSTTLNVTVTGDWTAGDEFEVVDGVTGDIIYPNRQVSLRWRDRGGTWTTAKTRTVVNDTDRIIWRMLGRSDDRVYEITMQDYASGSIIGAYADLSPSPEEF